MSDNAIFNPEIEYDRAMDRTHTIDAILSLNPVFKREYLNTLTTDEFNKELNNTQITFANQLNTMKVQMANEENSVNEDNQIVTSLESQINILQSQANKEQQASENFRHSVKR